MSYDVARLEVDLQTVVSVNVDVPRSAIVIEEAEVEDDLVSLVVAIDEDADPEWSS